MPRVIGHRGARAIEPENTLAGIEHAVELGVDVVEFDVRRTADGELVLMHDETVDRTTNGSGAVGELSLAEIRALDAGDGERVPTLEEALSLVAEFDVETYIELKEPGIAQAVLELTREHGVADDAEFITGNMEILARMHELGGTVGGGLPDLEPETLAVAAQRDYQHVGVRHEDVTAEVVERIHAHDIEVTAWPVNDRAETRRLVESGVDNINSDRPDVVLEALGRLDRERSTADDDSR